MGDKLLSKRKVKVALVIFDIALSMSLGLISSNIIGFITISGISLAIIGKTLHKMYLNAYPKEAKSSTWASSTKTKKTEITSSPTITKTKNLKRILKRKL